ncbi:MAG TPA: response regulator transcription factor [Spongiibacteraceae bacterium]|nr:response regulator transcription factor [Spongiibacteraceae bacterium]
MSDTIASTGATRAAPPFKVLIVEDDARFRDAFASAINAAADMTLAGVAKDFASGLALLAAQPDVMLVDLELPDGNGMDLIREAARTLPQCDVMVVTIFGDEQNVLRSIEAGATGYLLKDLPAGQLIEQIRILRAGGSPISPIIARQLLNRFTAPAPSKPANATNANGADTNSTDAKQQRSPLSEQETNVLALAAKGYSYDEIAGLLQLSHHTVQTYVKRIYRKLQVHSKIEALSEARRLSLISL